MDVRVKDTSMLALLATCILDKFMDIETYFSHTVKQERPKKAVKAETRVSLSER